MIRLISLLAFFLFVPEIRSPCCSWDGKTAALAVEGMGRKTKNDTSALNLFERCFVCDFLLRSIIKVFPQVK